MKVLEATCSNSNNITDEEIMYRDTRRVLDDYMHGLPVRLRQTFTLKKQGYKLKEIASYLRIKEQTVKNFFTKGGEEDGRTGSGVEIVAKFSRT